MHATSDMGTVTVYMVTGRNVSVSSVPWSSYETFERELGDRTKQVIGVSSSDGRNRKSFPRAKVLYMEWTRAAGRSSNAA